MTRIDGDAVKYQHSGLIIGSTDFSHFWGCGRGRGSNQNEMRKGKHIIVRIIGGLMAWETF
jgi:hypothetical protein